MFILNSEKTKIFARLHLLEEVAKGTAERLRALEITAKEISNRDKVALDIRAKKLAQQKERQREYNRTYKAKMKAKKEAEQVTA
jgi:hypothetical protein